MLRCPCYALKHKNFPGGFKKRKFLLGFRDKKGPDTMKRPMVDIKILAVPSSMDVCAWYGKNKTICWLTFESHYFNDMTTLNCNWDYR